MVKALFWLDADDQVITAQVQGWYVVPGTRFLNASSDPFPVNLSEPDRLVVQLSPEEYPVPVSGPIWGLSDMENITQYFPITWEYFPSLAYHQLTLLPNGNPAAVPEAIKQYAEAYRADLHDQHESR